MKVCKYCGTENDEKAKKCAQCGAMEFSHKCENCGAVFDSNNCPNCGVAAGTAPRVCPNCGRKTFSTHCPDCGTNLVEKQKNALKEQTIIVQPQYAPQYPNLSKKELKRIQKRIMVCKACGARISKKVKVCPHCGKKQFQEVYAACWIIVAVTIALLLFVMQDM